MKKVGLTLGKYAPFHKGHQHVIETALKEVDEMFVVIYDFAGIDIPLEKRAAWIKAIYPQVKIIEARNGPPDTLPKKELEKAEEKFILSLLNGQKITHFYSSEYYGDHVSKALGAVDRRIDEARKNVQISATQIRQDIFAHRHNLHPVVYRDLIKKIVFVGAPSTGKTTLAEALAKKYNTVWMPEYGREYWAENQVNRRIPLHDFDIIAKRHIEREDSLIMDANQYFFVDTNAITTYMFSLDYHGQATAELTEIALKCKDRYDIFFLCEDDIPYDDTWDRSGEQKRKVFQKRIVEDLQYRGINFISIKGSLEERIKQVAACLTDKQLCPQENCKERGQG
jgi:NadR type nicotinamide-nucleotide adenylyltransferase